MLTKSSYKIVIGRMIFMKNIKNTFMVSALTLGLIVGAVGVAGAATSTNYQQKVADWVKNDPNPMVMNINTDTIPVPVVTPAPAPVVTPAPVANQATQQWGNQQAPNQPAQNYNNVNNGYCRNGNGMSSNCW